VNPLSPEPVPRSPTASQVWFPDTSALITLAVHHPHPPLQQAVSQYLSAHRRARRMPVRRLFVAGLPVLAGGRVCRVRFVWSMAALG